MPIAIAQEQARESGRSSIKVVISRKRMLDRQKPASKDYIWPLREKNELNARMPEGQAYESHLISFLIFSGPAKPATSFGNIIKAQP
jgi:hypothetical protein